MKSLTKLLSCRDSKFRLVLLNKLKSVLIHIFVINSTESRGEKIAGNNILQFTHMYKHSFLLQSLLQCFRKVLECTESLQMIKDI